MSDECGSKWGRDYQYSIDLDTKANTVPPNAHQIYCFMGSATQDNVYNGCTMAVCEDDTDCATIRKSHCIATCGPILEADYA